MKIISLLAFIFFFNGYTLAQISTSFNEKNLSQVKEELTTIPESLNFSQQIKAYTHQEFGENKISIFKNSQRPIPSIYNYNHLAFFCKIEVKLEKAMKLPIKFRLGSVDYVDYLEGKRDSY